MTAVECNIVLEIGFVRRCHVHHTQALLFHLQKRTEEQYKLAAIGRRVGTILFPIVVPKSANML